MKELEEKEQSKTGICSSNKRENKTMAIIGLKYDRAFDSWVLDPIHIISFGSDEHKKRHSTAAETVVSSSSPVITSSSAESLRLFGLQRYLDNRKLWKRLRRYFTCCLGMPLPSDDHQGQHQDQDQDHAVISRTRRRSVASKNKKKKKVEVEVELYTSKNLSCVDIHTKSSFQEQEENIKAVIRYCKDTLSSTPSPSSSTTTTLSQG